MEVVQIKKSFQQSVWKVNNKSHKRIIEIVLGHLIISNYRIFKKYDKGKCIILIKKKGNQTQYLYFKVISSLNDQKQFCQQFHQTIKYVSNFIGRQQPSSQIIICSIIQKCYWLLAYQHIRQFFQKRNNQENSNQIVRVNLHQTQFSKKQIQSEIKIFDFKRIKEIINNYIDTFGQKYKNNHYFYQIVKQIGEVDIQTILNTISLIIFKQCQQKSYNQLQTMNWTTFSSQFAQKLSADRKDIVLSGCGKFLILDLIFFTSFKEYINQQYQAEVNTILNETSKEYSQSLLKVISITNEINEDQISYNYTVYDVGPTSIY